MEIRGTIFSMKMGKSLGPNGYLARFFKRFWPELKNEIMDCAKCFFQGKRLLQSVNHAFITLIPKNTTPMEMTDYRSISCTNTIYKI